jgi:hypothetical protein
MASEIIATKINKVTITPPASGSVLTIADGKTLTVTETATLDEAVAMSSKAPKASPIFTGDVTLAGNVTNATLPAFLAFNSADDANQTGNGAEVTIDFDTEVFDQGNNFAADKFTAPVAGKYHFDAQVTIYNMSVAMSVCTLKLITTNRTYLKYWSSPAFTVGQKVNLPFSVLADMDVGETAYVTLLIDGGADNTVYILGHATLLYTYFSGHLVS